MSSLHEVRWRLLWERLVKVYGEGRPHETETLPHGLAPDDNAEIRLVIAISEERTARCAARSSETVIMDLPRSPKPRQAERGRLRRVAYLHRCWPTLCAVAAAVVRPLPRPPDLTGDLR